jgi:hypothetical protein
MVHWFFRPLKLAGRKYPVPGGGYQPMSFGGKICIKGKEKNEENRKDLEEKTKDKREFQLKGYFS